MALTIQILSIILLSLSIVAVIRLWSVLGSARVALANLEQTRLEANETLKRLSEVAASTDRVMREEVAPTLQMTRATLENVEVTTRALAQTTQTIRRLTGQAEHLSTAQRLLALGGTVAQNVFGGKANKTPAQSSGSTGFAAAFAVMSRIRGLMARRKDTDNQTEQPRIERAKIERPQIEQRKIESRPSRNPRKTEPAPRSQPPGEFESTALTVGKDTPLNSD